MGDNGRAIYQSLLAQTDTEARTDYEYDPRVQMYESRRNGEAPPEAEFSARQGHGRDLLETTPQQNLRDLAADHFEEYAVQDLPETTPKTTTVLINTGYRDWTIQSDAYSNIFSFGEEKNIDLNGPQVPYYFNNVVVPLIAYETPSNAVIVGAGARNSYITPANVARQTFDTASGARIPAYFRTESQTFQPTYGWKIVTSNGLYLHTPAVFSYTDPLVQVSYYPTYDGRNPRGAKIGIDIQPKLYAANQYNYSTSKRFSNVSSIRLIRAMLPVRANQPWDPNIFLNASGNPLPMVYQDSFQNKAYSFMNIGNLDGAHYGGAQAVQKSFATLAQATRNLYDPFTLYPAQYIDHYPWASEAYKFDPPLRELSNANLQLVDEAGMPYSQLDTLNVVGVKVLGGTNLGKIKFFVSTNTLSFVNLSDPNVFYGKDIRVGDEIVFYRPAITQMISDPATTSNFAALFETFSNNYMVTDICSQDFAPTAILPIANYGTSFNAVPRIQTSNMSNLYTTLSSIFNSASPNIYFRSYAETLSGLRSGPTFSQEYVLPILNKNLQATFALEIITQEPDASKITKMIPATE